MSILGVIVRTRVEDLPATETALRALPGVDVAEMLVADGRLVIVIEDTAEHAAAATMAGIALWPQVLNTSLVYEYSGPDAPSPMQGVEQYADWRSSLRDLAQKPPRPA
ncbi:MAG: chaperone NapD [Burkholderiales bacterium]|nr:chaperone NapD [Burkholderiales bacterium]